MGDRLRTRLHHVGIIVPDREQVDVLARLLGLTIERSEYVPRYQADCHFTAGGSVELIVPRGGKLAGFNRGAGGLHHIALETDDLDAARRHVEEQGARMLEEQPVDAGPLRINFLPPVYTRGIIVEFVVPGADEGEGQP
jgi:catechol 2,3-dioxygenase-like lactoylglutathione lyase family enzyme